MASRAGAAQGIVRGEAGRDTRARHGGDGLLTPEAQATCLLDQATDPNILGRTCAHPPPPCTGSLCSAWASLQGATGINHSRAHMVAAETDS